MKCINIDRIQYGVGQGCFHGQEIIYGEEGRPASLTFRFIYDCGSSSDTAALKWAIKHFTENSPACQIDALYVSHFENDHVNGLEMLSERAVVKRIYVPYFSKAEATHIIAQSCFEKGVVSDLSSLVTTMATILATGSVGGIPVIMVKPSSRDPSIVREETDVPFEPPSDIHEGIRFPKIASDSSGAIVVSDAEAIEIYDDFLSAGSGKTVIWEVVHWAYSCDPDLTADIESEIRKIADSHLLFRCFSNSSSANIKSALNWIKRNFRALASAYNAGVKVYNGRRGKIRIELNHNVVSLCVYSGSVNFGKNFVLARKNGYASYSYGEKIPVSWIATGDALLADPYVWANFLSHFKITRIENCSSVLIPHHGSGRGGNFNEKLVTQDSLCIISSGCLNIYRHPDRSVTRRILGNGGGLTVVTEKNPLGLIEYIAIS